MLKKRGTNNGLVEKLYRDNIPDEIITRIAADFVIAAGDTVSTTLFK